MDSTDVSGRCFGCLWCPSGKNSLALSIALTARNMGRIQRLLTRRKKLQAMTKSMFLHLPWTPSRRSPHFGDKEMTTFVRQILAWPVQWTICIAETIYLGKCLKVCVDFFGRVGYCWVLTTAKEVTMSQSWLWRHEHRKEGQRRIHKSCPSFPWSGDSAGNSYIEYNDNGKIFLNYADEAVVMDCTCYVWDWVLWPTPHGQEYNMSFL